MRRPAEPLVVLVGAHGAIGRMHAAIYASVGVPTVEIDLLGPAACLQDAGPLPWDDVVIDVCTPTAVHTKTLLQAYALGARRFLVEKPAASSAQEWDLAIAAMPDAHIFVGHSYLFSNTFRCASEAAEGTVWGHMVFDKDRRADDAQGRGADPSGALPDILLVEMPHQVAMALTLFPHLRVHRSRYDALGVRGSARQPTACSMELATAGAPSLLLSSSLRAPRRRVLEVVGPEGSSVVAHFPTGPDLRGQVWRTDPAGDLRLLFDGRDDLLRATLISGLRSLQAQTVPSHASAAFAGSVLSCLDSARQQAAAVPAEPFATDEAPSPSLPSPRQHREAANTRVTQTLSLSPPPDPATGSSQ